MENKLATNDKLRDKNEPIENDLEVIRVHSN